MVPTIALCGSTVKSLHRRRMPVIAPGQPGGLVEALLDDRPLALGGDHERVQVDLESVGDGVVVDPGREAAGPDQRLAIESGAPGDLTQLVGRAQGMTAPAAADVDAQLVRARR